MPKKFSLFIAGLAAAMLLVRYLPWLPLETRVTWTTYCGLILMFFVGAATATLLKKASLGIAVGIIILAIVVVLLQSFPQVVGG